MTGYVYRLRRAEANRAAYGVSLALLVLSLTLDTASTVALRDSAGPDIGTGIVRLFSWLLALIGVFVTPTITWGSAQVSWLGKRQRKYIYVALGVIIAFVVGGIIKGCTSGPSSPEAPRNSITSSFDNIPGQIIGNDKLVGTCVHLHGDTVDSPVADAVPCTSPQANYKIIQVTKSRNECVSDADQRYYSKNGRDESTFCLDYNWTASKCVKMAAKTAWNATVADCSDIPHFPLEKPHFVILNSESPAGCPDGGWTHPQRKFTVCTTTIGSSAGHFGG
ncbi:hypothetical protein [Mycobacteroides salmoniphilum]|uniref:LppU/SCO3897 family protein n=1 Tax=Mycobacteroides salmoniphilum TaxID=404941 RepID=UPI0010AAEEBE|nr:hypothetical protein [Mycobacteroides salmoniphilum]